MEELYKKARTFIYRNARPLDFARWRFHFENGTGQAVLDALSQYQNGDGGFGHALEADAWNPVSTPVQTWTATEIVRETGIDDPSNEIVRGILRYLESGRDFDGTCWYFAVKSNAAYPHAPWWHTENDTANGGDYNPSASLAGFILRNAQRDSALYDLGSRVAQEAFSQLQEGAHENGMHTLTCYVRLLQYLTEAGISDVIDLAALEDTLRGHVRAAITQETETWETAYVCKPSQFLESPQSVFYAGSREIAEFECEFIQKTQLDDGSWNVNWNWGAYPDEWAVSRNWWKSAVIIRNLLYLRGFGRLKTQP
ncbi:MAG TPA: hypothetical protein P5075_07265 [Eubacteriales bacterium]|nr:hypothetical protein [Eubacteriales bacterium]